MIFNVLKIVVLHFCRRIFRLFLKDFLIDQLILSMLRSMVYRIKICIVTVCFLLEYLMLVTIVICIKQNFIFSVNLFFETVFSNLKNNYICDLFSNTLECV